MKNLQKRNHGLVLFVFPHGWPACALAASGGSMSRYHHHHWAWERLGPWATRLTYRASSFFNAYQQNRFPCQRCAFSHQRSGWSVWPTTTLFFVDMMPVILSITVRPEGFVHKLLNRNRICQYANTTTCQYYHVGHGLSLRALWLYYFHFKIPRRNDWTASVIILWNYSLLFNTTNCKMSPSMKARSSLVQGSEFAFPQGKTFD